MNHRHTKRLDALEPAILATIPLAACLEPTLQRLSTDHTIPVDKVRQEAVRVAIATRGMTDDERLAHVAGELGGSPVALRGGAPHFQAEIGA